MLTAPLSRYAALAAAVLPILTFTAIANAQAGAPAGGNQLLSFVPIIFAFVVMIGYSNYKQGKQRKERAAFLNALTRGEEVVTTGGLLGRIEGMTDLYLTLEIAPGTRIKVLRSAIMGLSKNVVPATSEVKA
ncbi:MAG: preprotein translocase subunit YajC [Proteobacteria bacterium]|nr:MAG: preprotein translocase subunit YajC [Pseudomonadota bacterium]